MSQYETGILFVAPLVMDYMVNGRQLSRTGNRCSCAAPHGAFRCKGDDRWCSIAVFTDGEWQNLCRILGNPAWTKDPKFSTLLSRKRNEDELDKHIEDWTSKLFPEEVMKRMQDAGVPSGVVETAEDLFNDKQLQHRGHFQILQHPETGDHAYECLGFRLSKTPHELRREPCLGEHSEEVYTKMLGFSNEEFIGLLNDGVIE